MQRGGRETQSSSRALALLAGVPLLAIGCGGHVAVVGDGPLTRFRTYPRDALASKPDTDTGGGRRIGCLDLGIERVSDPEARLGSVTIAFVFGNRCVHELEVRFDRLRVTARDPDGRELVLPRADRKLEGRPRTLDGRAQGSEVVEFDASGAGESPKVVCVDATGVVSAPAPSPPVCFVRAGDGIEHRRVVGYPSSPAIGDGWHSPPIYFFAELSAVESTIGLSDATFTADLPGGRRLTLRGLDRVATFGAVDHFNVRLAGPFYVGATLITGGGHLGPRGPFSTGDVTARTGSTVAAIGAGALVGVMSRPLGNLRFRADGALGGSIVFVDVDVPGCGDPRCASVSAGRTWFTPRLVLDAWLTPWWTVSAWGAADVLHLPDVSVGLALGFHVRSFDGFP